jgi:hypothetical protein
MLGIDFASQGLETICDLYMAQKFISHFLFFLKIKVLKLNQLGLKLSFFNRFIIFWLFLLIVLNIFYSFSRLFFSPLVENRLITNEDPDFAYLWETVDLWLLNAYIPIADLFTHLTFLYLFYFQAISRINAEKDSVKAESVNGGDSRELSLHKTREDIRKLFKHSNSVKINQKKSKIAGRQKYSAAPKNLDHLSKNTSINEDYIYQGDNESQGGNKKQLSAFSRAASSQNSAPVSFINRIVS